MKSKTFDCIEMKRRGAERLRQRLAKPVHAAVFVFVFLAIRHRPAPCSRIATGPADNREKKSTGV
jgi:hypothetical protein